MPLEDVRVGDELVVFPHEICPVDGVVDRGPRRDGRVLPHRRALHDVEGARIRGALRGHQRRERAHRSRRQAGERLALRQDHAGDARLGAEPAALRRLGDQLGAFYTPLAFAIALAAWVVSGDPVRFLAVLVVATPCPLLIAHPGRDHRRDLAGGPRGIIIKTRPCSSRSTLPHVDLRQDRHADLRRADAHRPIPGARTWSRDGARWWPASSVLEASAGRRRSSTRADGGRLALLEASAIEEQPGEGLAGASTGGRSRSPAAGRPSGGTTAARSRRVDRAWSAWC